MTRQGLRQFFKGQAVKWAVFGLFITLVFSVPCLVYVGKIATERQISSLALTTAMAFRPLILRGGVRDAQLQIAETLKLKGDESAVIRDAKLKMVYSMDGNGDIPTCGVSERYCWSSGFRSIEYLYPIYFDEHRQSLFGYLDLKMKPMVDLKLLSFVVLLVLFGFIVQSFGLISALNTSAREVTDRLSGWAKHLKEAPGNSVTKLPPAPFLELEDMQEAVNGLHLEIVELQKLAANQARTEAQLHILREIGHELKTPISQLKKMFAVYNHNVEKTGKIDSTQTGNIERVMKKMSEIVQQVRALKGQGQVDKDATCELSSEARTLIDDLRFDTEVAQKNVQVEFDPEFGALSAKVPKITFQRILENLLRNSIQAAPDGSVVTVSTRAKKGRPTLIVSDRGPGIPEQIRGQIFDFDFSTKPGRGMGIGLGIVKNLCAEFGAEIELKSEPGKFTEFEISFVPNENRSAV